MRDALKQQRLIKNMSVAQISGILDISQSFYYKIEENKRNPTISLASRIADVLGISVAAIFFDSQLDETYNNGQDDRQKNSKDCSI